ncbi:hypothetical protein L210DRAFT_3647900 [Boletus edulis BED1]|uniref:Uncharacterized protein n=1 Tax=Boletus edulis BED1 TaxID=1328754 RepID=A0AAD4BQ04_BOLED|nr:hypothetical protein L210DRAFT_3647900 [Boletus edulis BED1]
MNLPGPSGLNNLGNSFIIRFERLGELSDLEDAISTLRDPLHPCAPCLTRENS